MTPVTKYIQQIIQNQCRARCSVLIVFCPLCWTGTQMCWRQCSWERSDMEKDVRAAPCASGAFAAWLTLTKPQLAFYLFIFLTNFYSIRHLYNSAQKSDALVRTCWCPFDHWQLLLEVQLKEICLMVSVCYINEKFSSDAVLSTNRISVFYICCGFSIYLFFFPPLHAFNSNLTRTHLVWLALQVNWLARLFFLFLYFFLFFFFGVILLACSIVTFLNPSKKNAKAKA